MVAGTPDGTAQAAAQASPSPARSRGRATRGNWGQSSGCHRTPSAAAVATPDFQAAAPVLQASSPCAAAVSDRPTAPDRGRVIRAGLRSALRLPAAVQWPPAVLAA